MRLVVGLGNPGADYARNRHNVGFMAADVIATRYSFSAWRKRFKGETAEGTVDGERVLLLKPLTYMNESGQSVAEAAHFLKIDPAQVYVMHDELDLAPGRLRVKKGGGAAGHNGLRSIDAHLGNDFWRVRIGIGHPGHKALVLKAVLGDFAKADLPWLVPLLDAIADELPLLLADDANAYMSRIALKAPAPDNDKPDQS
ncbi:MAG TPA: aminoacyl-tRNA hydrolase [Magnetospirillaceae bacterium]|jgi:PTH1 family peptidyl-tRNA hydrolase